MTAVVSITSRLWARQLAQMSRKIMTTAMTLELAAERGDWDCVHQTHEELVDLFAGYRLLYRRALVHRERH